MKNNIYNIQAENILQYITVPLEELKINAKILVDCGAQVSIVKQGNIPESRINKATITYVTGITDDSLKTLGTTDLKINGINFEFHVVPNNFKFPYDGILGINCLSTQKLRLDKGYLEINKSKIKLKSTREEKDRYIEKSEEVVRNAQCIAFNEADYLSGIFPTFLINSVALNKDISKPQENCLQSDIVENCYVDEKDYTIDSYPDFLSILREHSPAPKSEVCDRAKAEGF